jgi:hypothetical protein
MKIFRRATLKVLQVVRSRGVFAGLKMVINHLHGERSIQSFDEIKAYFHGKNCLEIGGPSFIFQPKSILPVYVLMNNIDNVNFSSKTVWGDNVLAPNYPKNNLGRQFILEATDLRGIEDKSYDCVLSSHVLEHVANRGFLRKAIRLIKAKFMDYIETIRNLQQIVQKRTEVQSKRVLFDRNLKSQGYIACLKDCLVEYLKLRDDPKHY